MVKKIMCEVVLCIIMFTILGCDSVPSDFQAQIDFANEENISEPSEKPSQLNVNDIVQKEGLKVILLIEKQFNDSDVNVDELSMIDSFAKELNINSINTSKINKQTIKMLGNIKKASEQLDLYSTAKTSTTQNSNSSKKLQEYKNKGLEFCEIAANVTEEN